MIKKYLIPANHNENEWNTLLSTLSSPQGPSSQKLILQ